MEESGSQYAEVGRHHGIQKEELIMAEEALSKTGKRGAYTESSVNLELSQDQRYWNVSKKAKPPELARVDNQRNKINKELNEQRQMLIGQIKRKEPKTSTKEATAIVNYQIYGQTGKKKPRDFTFTEEHGPITLEQKTPPVTASIDRAKALYTQRVPLDEKSKELRKNEDNSFRKLYDKVRDARNQHRSSVYINNSAVPLSKIIPVKDGKNNTVGYRIGSDIIKRSGNATTQTVTVSILQKRTETIIKQKIVGRRAKNRVVFTRVGASLQTKSPIGKFFDKQTADGKERVIYLNNKAFTENDFIKVGNEWQLTSAAEAELSSPEIEGKVSVRFSYIYQPRFRILEVSSENLTPAKAPEVTYAEIDSTVTIGGQQVETVIKVDSVEALIALKESRRLNKLGGAFSVVATNFRIDKQGNKYIISISSVIGGRTPVPNDNLEPYYSKDEFVIISWVQDKSKTTWQFSVTVKSPLFNMTSNLSDFNNPSP